MSSLPGPESPSERYRASAERAAEAKTYLGGFIRSLSEGRYREAERVVLIMDQFNTRS